MEARDQRSFEFAATESAARDRSVQLGRALRDLGASADVCLLARLIYDQTHDGVGAAWQPEGGDEILLEHAWGLRCKKSTLFTIKKSRAYRSLIVAIDGNYQINWHGVYAARGLPLPQSLAGYQSGANESAVAGVRAAHATSGPSLECENRVRAASGFSMALSPTSGHHSPEVGLESPGVGQHSPGPGLESPESGLENRGDAQSIYTRARLFPCFLLLSSTTTTTDKETIRRTYREYLDRIFAHKPGAKLKREAETRRFVACVAAIAVRCGEEIREWVELSVAITERKNADIPPAFLRNVLRNGLISHLGVCESEADAMAALGKLLANARPIAKEILAMDAGESPVRSTPPEAYSADHPEDAEQLPPRSGREILREGIALARAEAAAR